MKTKFKAALAALRGSRGSGIVLVLVAIICISGLASTIMYMAYTGYRIKLTQRESVNDFYSASTALEEIRAGLEERASQAIKSAYETTLSNYNNPEYKKDPDPTKTKTLINKFQEQFCDDFKLTASEIGTFVSEPGLVTITVGDLTTNPDGSGFTLNNLNVSYKKNNFTTSVSTDIKIGVPDFSYVISYYSISGLPEFTSIVGGTLKQDGVTADISGSVYAGNVSVTNTMNIKDGTLICGGTIDVASTFTTKKTDGPKGKEPSLWAKNIDVKAGGELNLSGSTYVANDLRLSGKGARAKLSGQYFGFGNSLSAPEESSAILVTGRETELDINGLERLILAGHSFVSNPTASDSDKGILMGESFSTKQSQQAYLIPAEFLISGSNPEIYNSDSPPTANLNALGTNALTLYGASTNTYYKTYGSQKIAYHFYKFNDSEKANDFFKAYFSTYPEKVKRYLDNYVKTINNASLENVMSAGYVPKKSGSDYSFIGVSDYNMENPSNQAKATYIQLCKTLFQTVTPPEGVNNPFDYFVNTTDINSLHDTKTQFKDASGQTVGIIKKGNVTSADINSNIKVIVATGNVTLDTSFTGLIICGGNLTLKGSLTANDTDVAEALKAKYTYTDDEGKTHTETMYSYIINTGYTEFSDGESETIGSEKTYWDVGALFTYSNWTKTQSSDST